MDLLSGRVKMPRRHLPTSLLQGNLAHKKLLPRKTLQQAYAQDPTVVPAGGQFLMGEVPL